VTACLDSNDLFRIRLKLLITAGALKQFAIFCGLLGHRFRGKLETEDLFDALVQEFVLGCVQVPAVLDQQRSGQNSIDTDLVNQVSDA